MNLCYNVRYLGGKRMEFNSKGIFNCYLRSLRFIGQGSQGMCFLRESDKTVIKVFNEYFDNEKCGYSEDFLLRFSGIKNGSFLWPRDVILVNGEVVGYTSSYRKASNLCDINPLSANLDSLERAVTRIERDVKVVTDSGVKLYDVRYNILYNRGRMYVIDTLEYMDRRVSFRENMNNIDEEVMLFLVDGFFDDFVNKDLFLKEMYMGKDVSSVLFLKEFRKRLGEYMGREIVKLDTCKGIVKRKGSKVYIRGGITQN